mmetsp:Transcript_3190/g.5270  ORF Transcript_3190/g.5270 Transcript_3190/m.5270 type:complete len:121 (-) Transcript_3190:433-795(-)
MQLSFYLDTSSTTATTTNLLLKEWSAWIRKWIKALVEDEAEPTSSAITARLRSSNPKYVPREWMLVDAYNAAQKGDLGPVHELHDLFSAPYDEQSDERHEKFYRKSDAENLTKPGVAHMT